MLAVTPALIIGYLPSDCHYFGELVIGKIQYGVVPKLIKLKHLAVRVTDTAGGNFNISSQL